MSKISSLVQAPSLLCHANNTKYFALFRIFLNIEFLDMGDTGNITLAVVLLIVLYCIAYFGPYVTIAWIINVNKTC